LPFARLAALLVAVFALLAGSAMLRTSTTFDEIVFPAVGARALATGDFGMVDDHPRMPQLIYGLPLHLWGVRIPPDSTLALDPLYRRYHFARELYWRAGNPPENVTLIARLPGLLFGVLTIAAVFLLSRRHMPQGAALLAAALTAFLPDMLGHSGVAYNDVPLAFGVLVSLYAFDALVRRPTPALAVAAGLAAGFTITVKYSGLIVLAAAAVMLAIEARARWREAGWRRALAMALGVFALTAYIFIVMLYGDWRLGAYLDGFAEMSRNAGGRFAYLLGQRSTQGWWYFFPVAFALKTPAGLHVLAGIALIAGAASLARTRGAGWPSHGARAPAIGAALFLGAVMAAKLNIGMRHALPMLPLVCILVAQGVAWAWDRSGRLARGIAAVATVAVVASTLRAYPYFISYLSEYATGRPLYRTLVDSSTDWGQGLVALREYMKRKGIDRVGLAYFGSALPEGYGIEYAALPSYFPRPVDVGARPRFVAISATLLAGGYVEGDPYARMRDVEPVAVVGGTIYVFDLADGEPR
jgi:hypothetical protein